LALTAATMFKLGRKDVGLSLASDLEKFQGNDGSVSSQDTTITRSGGEAKVIETTGIAVLAWLNDGKYFANVTKAVEYLAKSWRKGSTQATVLALKAIVAYDGASAKSVAEGSVIARLNGEDVECIGIDTKTCGTITMPNFGDKVKAGTYTLEIEMIGGSKMPYTFALEYNALSGPSSSECVIDFDAKLSKDKVSEGEGLEIDVHVANKTDKGQPMTVALIGIPGGCEFRHEKLQELVKSKVVDYYETMGRVAVLYWRCLAPSDKKNFKVDLIAAVPGDYVGPASRAYLYYTNEYKKWISGLHVTIAPK